MLYFIIGLSLFIMAIGFIVNAGNAKHFLAGYNTMKEEERAKVDIHGFLSYFRNFHLFLGLTMMIGGLLLWYLGHSDYATMFIAIFPMLGYMYFMWNSRNYFPSNKKNLKLGLGVMGLTVLFVAYIFYGGNKDNTITINDNTIHISGSYGEEVNSTDIASIKIVKELPKISRRTNGYASGGVSKGHFRTKEGEKVKLFINNRDDSFIKIDRTEEKTIYYSSKSESTQTIFNDLKEAFPNKVM